MPSWKISSPFAEGEAIASISFPNGVTTDVFDLSGDEFLVEMLRLALRSSSGVFGTMISEEGTTATDLDYALSTLPPFFQVEANGDPLNYNAPLEDGWIY